MQVLRKLVQDVVEDQREELRSVWKEGIRRNCVRLNAPPPKEEKVSYFEYCIILEQCNIYLIV